jgi:hypothetical protein
MVAVSINDSRGMFVCFNSPFTVFHCASPRYITRFENPIYSKCKSIVKQWSLFTHKSVRCEHNLCHWALYSWIIKMDFTLSETSKGKQSLLYDGFAFRIDRVGECCNIGCCFPLNNCTDNLLLYFSGIGFVRMVAVSINDSRGMFVCFNSPFTVFHCASPRYITVIELYIVGS